MAIIKRRLKPKGRGRPKTHYGVRIERDGRQKWVGTFDNESEARAAEAEAKLRTPESPPTRGGTVEAWVARWLADRAERVKGSTLITTTHQLRRFRADFGPRALRSLGREEAKDWAREHRWCVPAVVACLNEAKEDRLIDENPFRGLSRKTRGRRDIIPPSVADVDALAEAALAVHGAYGPTMAALIRVLAYTAIRPGEAFALEWEDINLAGSSARIRRRLYKGEVDAPKSNLSRDIYLPPAARDALMTLPGPRTGRVFRAKRGGGLSQSALSGYWAPVRAQALPERPEVTPYYLKHFGGHYLRVTKGLPAHVVAAQFGHTDGGRLIDELYGHPSHGALEQIAAAFEGGGEVIPVNFSDASAHSSSNRP